MKNMKKLFSLALALVMMMALVVTAGAATNLPTGSSTKPQVESGKGIIELTNGVTGGKYTVYKIFDAVYNESQTAVSYTVAKNSYWYNLISTNSTVTVGDNTISASDCFSLSQKGSTDDYYVTRTMEVKTEGAEPTPKTADADVIDWLNGNLNGATAATQEYTATGDGSIYWSLPYGYYMINSTSGGKSVVTIDTLDNEVKVIAKNEQPGWGNEGKKVIVGSDGEETTLNSVNVGDTITFKIYSNGAKNYDEDNEITKYVFHDQMSEKLKFNNDVAVYVNGDKEANKLAEGAFTVTENASHTVGDNTEKCTFDVTIPWQNDDGSFKYTQVNNTIMITYTATVQSSVTADTALKNIAKMSWNENVPGDPGKETNSYVYDFDLSKVNSKDESLTGAEFTLSQMNGAVKTPLKFVEVKNADGDLTGYEYSTAASGTTTTLKAGSINVSGLKAGTYYLTEDVAPSGYNKLTDDVVIVIGEVNNEDGTVTKTIKVGDEILKNGDNYSDLVKVVNNQGTELPSTGGIGTTIFTVTGAILMIGAAVLFLTKKRTEA